MDNQEARSILSARPADYQLRSYPELAAWLREGRIDTAEVCAPNGKRYQVEVQFLWDDKPGGHVRVVGSVDGGNWHAFAPATDSFILRPSGEFVGE